MSHYRTEEGMLWDAINGNTSHVDYSIQTVRMFFAAGMTPKPHRISGYISHLKRASLFRIEATDAGYSIPTGAPEPFGTHTDERAAIIKALDIINERPQP